MIDYTKIISTAAQKGYDEGLRTYMLKIYNYMGLALFVTAVAAFITLNFEPFTRLVFNISPSGYITGNTGLGTILMLSPLGIALYFFIGIGKMKVETAKVLFWVYAALTGISLSSLGFIYTGESIARTFLVCSSLFGAMSLYGYTTKRDLTAMGSFLVMGLIGLLITSLFNMFFQSAAINFATSIIGVLIFTGLIAWDTQKLKSYYYLGGGGDEMGQKTAIMGAFSLYLDFINLFLYLIRFMGQRRN